MKRFSVPCDFGGRKVPFNIYIGAPNPKNHPLQHQQHWLSSERGGSIPPDVMASFEKLWKISQENGVSFEDLCVYAMGAAAEEKKAAPVPADSASGDGGGDTSALPHMAPAEQVGAVPQEEHHSDR